MTSDFFIRRYITPCVALFGIAVLTSQSAMDLFSTLLCMFAIYHYFQIQNPLLSWKKPLDWKGLFPRIGIEKAFLSWWVVVALGFLLNSNHEGPIAKRLIEFKWIIILYLLIYIFQLLQIKKEQIKFFYLPLFVVSIATIAMFLIKYDYETKTYVEHLRDMRAAGFFSPMTYAHSFAMIFFVFLGASLWIQKKSWQENTWVWGNLVMLGLTVLLTMTRGVWAGVFVGFIFCAFRWSRRKGLSALLAGLVSFVLLFFSWQPFAKRILQVFDYKNNYDAQRITLWKANWNIFLDFPFLGFGYGENSRRLREYYDRMGIPEGQFEGHAHNQYLHLLAGTGLIGLGIYLWIIFFFIKQTINVYKIETDQFWKGILLGCLGAQVSFHIASFTEANFEHSKVRFVLMIVWALVIARRNKPSATK